MQQLTVRQHMTLALAGQTFRYEAVRAGRALAELGYTETRFWQIVDHLIDTPAALEAYPALVHRLQRLRGVRRARRRRAA